MCSGSGFSLPLPPRRPPGFGGSAVRLNGSARAAPTIAGEIRWIERRPALSIPHILSSLTGAFVLLSPPTYIRTSPCISSVPPQDPTSIQSPFCKLRHSSTMALLSAPGKDEGAGRFGRPAAKLLTLLSFGVNTDAVAGQLRVSLQNCK